MVWVQRIDPSIGDRLKPLEQLFGHRFPVGRIQERLAGAHILQDRVLLFNVDVLVSEAWFEDV
jgi:hypothetical protein